jgi:hypothetical protein
MALYLRDGRTQDQDLRQMEEILENSDLKPLDTSKFPNVGDEHDLGINRSMTTVQAILDHLANLDLSDLEITQLANGQEAEYGKLFIVRGGSTPITVKAPATIEDGKMFIIKNQSNVEVTIDGNGHNIDSGTEHVLKVKNETVVLVGYDNGTHSRFLVKSNYKPEVEKKDPVQGEASIDGEYELPSHIIKIKLSAGSISITDGSGATIPLTDTFRNSEALSYEASKIGTVAIEEVKYNGVALKSDDVIVDSADTLKVDLTNVMGIDNFLLYDRDLISIN